jgi:hypothetical protein
VIAAALLLQATSAPSASYLGPFAVTTENVVHEQAFPYPVNLKVTTLRWKAPSGLASYELTDDGGRVELTFEVGLAPRNCSVLSRELRLTAAPPRSFAREALLACPPVLDSRQSATLTREVRAARRYYAGAYRIFFGETIRQHGPLLQRCRGTTMGYHGLDCVKFWDEGRNATSHQKDKRNR